MVLKLVWTMILVTFGFLGGVVLFKVSFLGFCYLGFGFVGFGFGVWFSVGFSVSCRFCGVGVAFV